MVLDCHSRAVEAFVLMVVYAYEGEEVWQELKRWEGARREVLYPESVRGCYTKP